MPKTYFDSFSRRLKKTHLHFFIACILYSWWLRAKITTSWQFQSNLILGGFFFVSSWYLFSWASSVLLSRWAQLPLCTGLRNLDGLCILTLHFKRYIWTLALCLPLILTLAAFRTDVCDNCNFSSFVHNKCGPIILTLQTMKFVIV